MSLAELFGDRQQLLVYHFMFAPDWERGCKSCAFWADNFNGITAHLAQRDIRFVAVSRAPLPKLQAFAKRLGWSFPWVSSGESDFNFDYQVSFRPEQRATGKIGYNYSTIQNSAEELPGISVFYKAEEGSLFHTYFPMAWLALHDEYAR